MGVSDQEAHRNVELRATSPLTTSLYGCLGVAFSEEKHFKFCSIIIIIIIRLLSNSEYSEEDMPNPVDGYGLYRLLRDPCITLRRPSISWIEANLTWLPGLFVEGTRPLENLVES